MYLKAKDRSVFISHANYDGIVAKVLKDALLRAGVGGTFLDADDILPGDNWLGRIRAALTTCDAIITVLTPQYADRLWMSAEWACFWSTEKPCYTLRLGVAIEDVFKPMTIGSQIADLSSVDELTLFLDAIAEDNVDNYRLAKNAVERIARARDVQRTLHLEDLLHEIVFKEGVVGRSTIADVIIAGGAGDLLKIHERLEEANNGLSNLRLRNVARALVTADIPPADLVPLTRAIDNSNYRREIVIDVLASPAPIHAKVGFADALFGYLSTVARSRVVAAATELGYALPARWDGVDGQPFAAT